MIAAGFDSLTANVTQEEAIHTANIRNDWYVTSTLTIDGPYSEEKARERITELLTCGYKPQLLRAVEDYQD